MWRWFKRRQPVDSEIEEEVDYHLAMLAEERLAQNDNPADAAAYAQRKMGNQTRIKETTKEVWRMAWLDSTRRDLTFAARMLGRAPLFYASVVGILALGIAATSALFSLVDGVLLRPLPYWNPARLCTVTSYSPTPPYASNGSVSYRDYQVIADRAKAFSELAVTFRDGWSRVTLEDGGEPTPLQGAFVSPNLFSMLGRQPILGRTFSEAENRRGERVILINAALWAQCFGSDPNVLGKDLRLDKVLWRVIGIMPNDFRAPFLKTQVWAPILSHPRWNDRSDGEPVDKPRWDLLARLRPGVELTGAQAEIDAIEARLKASSPDLHEDNLRVVPLREHFTGPVRTPLLILLSAVGMLLLIACANVANLLLAQASQRQRELSIRVTLGAGRGQLLRQLLTETMAYSFLAAVLGLAGAAVLVPLLTRLAPATTPLLDSVVLDRRVVLFAAAVSLCIGVGLSAVIAWRIRWNGGEVKGTGRTSTETVRNVRTKSILVVAEFAMATILTSGAFLLIRSFVAVLNVDPGFPTDRILTVRLGLPTETNAAQATQFYGDAFARLVRLPGVRWTGGISNLFFLDESRVHALRQVEGHAPEPLNSWKPLVWAQVGGDYFQAMGIPLLAGRLFNERDTSPSPPVAIVNETLARRYWPGESAVGKHLKGFDPRGRHDDWLTVVGVVKDTHSGGMERAAFSQVYEVQTQRGDQLNNLVLRATGDPTALASSVRAVLRQMNHDATIVSISTMEQLLSAQTASRRFQTWLVGTFSALALGLAALGVFAIMHYSVAVRTNEMGIRMALGAKPGNILLLISGEAARLVATGVVLGLIGAVWSAKAMASLLFQVKPIDPWSVAAAALTPLMLALVACYPPALRASRVDPMRALRDG